MPRIRHHELGLLAAVAIAVLALGGVLARDLRRSVDDASRLHDRWSQRLDLIQGSLPEGVALDDDARLKRFNDARLAIGDLKSSVASDAEAQVTAARVRAQAATVRLIILVLSGLLGTAVGIYLVNRRAALEGLLRVEGHKGSILQALPDPVISTDATGRIIEVNQAAERAFGFSRPHALGAPVGDMVFPHTRRDEIAAIMAQEPESALPVARRFETLGARRDGSVFPVEIAAVMHLAGADRIWTLHVSDITERRRSEQELRDAKESAEAAARAENDFLATMSHELRTPLNGVIGIADLLQNADLPAPQRDQVRMLRSSTTALMGIVSSVLDYSRIERGLIDLSPVNFRVRDCIEDALSPIAQLAAQKGLEVGYVIDAGVPATIRSDEGLVRQVLLNLLSNAVKFTDAGEVAIHVSAQRIAGKGVAITISVRDSGRGIPEGLQQKLFQRFSPIDAASARQHGGAGLGLAISKRLSELLSGSLTVTSREGSGATFRFVFLASVVPGSSTDALAGSLAGVTVLAVIGTGIVGEQIRGLLSGWGVRAIRVVDDPAPVARPTEEFHAFVVDAGPGEGRLLDLTRRCRVAWGLDHLPAVIVARIASSGLQVGGTREYGVGKPLSASRLHEALSLAVRGTDAALLHAGAPSRIAPLPRTSLAILLVEDNTSNRRVMQMMLEELGLVADEAANGVEAIERALAREYDVILMDVQMPGLDGLETTRRIRAQSSGARPVIVALTANVMLGEEARCLDAGMDGYLSKPVRLDTLAAILRRLVEAHR